MKRKKGESYSNYLVVEQYKLKEGNDTPFPNTRQPCLQGGAASAKPIRSSLQRWARPFSFMSGFWTCLLIFPTNPALLSRKGVDLSAGDPMFSTFSCCSLAFSLRRRRTLFFSRSHLGLCNSQGNQPQNPREAGRRVLRMRVPIGFSARWGWNLAGPKLSPRSPSGFGATLPCVPGAAGGPGSGSGNMAF
jgi:hypothetical protein